MPTYYENGILSWNFFGLWNLSLNLNFLAVFIPSFFRWSIEDVWNWGWGLANSEDIAAALDPDAFFEYDAMFAFLTGNAFNPFGWFYAEFKILVDALAG